jgi:hypothetical protein
MTPIVVPASRTETNTHTATATAGAWWPRSIPITQARARVAALVIATTLAFGFRTASLSTYGLSEDEVNKVRAIEQYRDGHFAANAEHPMLMKLAMWGSVELSRGWNRIVPADRAMPIETAIRLPNALAGTLITVALFGIVELLFGTSAAIAASLLWALDVNAIATNRIGKEDTFLLMFFLLGVWAYERAKRQGTTDPGGAQRWYVAAGVSFGLMLASKYMPHYFGIYALFNAITDRNAGANRPHQPRYYGAMALAFVGANFAILLPETWRYCLSYVHGGMLTHHGYLYAGQLYVTSVPISPLGVPATFYLRFLATKVPIAVLMLSALGLIEAVRHREERGFVLIRVLLVLVLLPYSLMAAKFLRYTLPMLTVMDITAAVGLVALVRWIMRGRWLSLPQPERLALAAASVSLSLAAIAAAPATATPFYSMFQNTVGERLAQPGATFPEETYDFGVREAVSLVLSNAQPSALIVSDAPAVVAEYVKRSARPDLRVRALSAGGLPNSPDETWVIIQDEHMSFENQALVDQLRHRLAPWREFHAGPALATQLFHIAGVSDHPIVRVASSRQKFSE